MKKKRDGKEPNMKAYVSLIIFVIAVGLFYYIGFFNKTCEDASCFDEAVKNCKPVDYVKNSDNNLYLYTVYRSTGPDCILRISLQSVAPGTERDIKDLLEGKSMKCKIPKEMLAETSLEDAEDMLSFCSGELKEGIYELIIKRIYGLVIGNIDEIRDVVKGNV